MKRSFKKVIAPLFYILIVIFVSSCDLSLQEGFDFEPEVDLTDPYADMTAWEFIQSRNVANDDGSLNGEELDYMIAAIKAAGMENEYSGTDPDRTYLLLNNNAFVGGGDVIQSLPVHLL